MGHGRGACLQLMQQKPWWLPSPLRTLCNLSAYLNVPTSYLQLQSSYEVVLAFAPSGVQFSIS